MGTRNNPSQRIRWALLLAFGIFAWLTGAFFVSRYLEGQVRMTDQPAGAASIVYLAILIFVMALGNFARVRTLLTLEILYGIGVLVRAATGLLTALMILETPAIGVLDGLLEAFVRPFAGLAFLSAQITGHFVMEIYWLGLGMSAAILVFLASASMMSVSSRIRREKAWRRQRRQQDIQEQHRVVRPRTMQNTRPAPNTRPPAQPNSAAAKPNNTAARSRTVKKWK